jgi:class 3 adenylate cyclase
MLIPSESFWKLQNSLFAAGVAVALGAAYATAIGGRPWVGAANGAVIGGSIAVIGTFVIERFQGHFLNRMGLAFHIGITTIIWALVIIATLETARAILDHPWGALPGDHPHNTFFQDVAFALAVGFLVSFVSRLQALIGMRTLFDFLIGKYARPLSEDRTVLILDLADSTTLAEKLGATKVQALIGRFFFDISQPIAEYGGDIHQYIGDAVVVTWPSSEAPARSQAINCVFALQDLINREGESYRAEFGTIPDFRAGLHSGSIVVSEVGDRRRAIAYFGDTMNTTARLQQSCKRLGQKFLVSEALMSCLQLPQFVAVEDIGEIALEGKTQAVHAFGLRRDEEIVLGPNL